MCNHRGFSSGILLCRRLGICVGFNLNTRLGLPACLSSIRFDPSHSCRLARHLAPELTWTGLAGLDAPQVDRRRQMKRAGLLANDGHDGHHSDDGLTAAEGAAKLLANK